MRKVPLLALTIAFICVSVGPLAASDTHKITVPAVKDYTIYELFELKRPAIKPKPKYLQTHSRMLERIEDTEFTITVMNKTSLGWYFITAYCPAECGWNGDPDNLAGWYTASGEICHRADYEDRLTAPTTCAIDRNYHSFGDMFYIEEFDRVFVAEDTGLFSGYWLDLFYEDYDDVLSFPTGYYEVFSVEYETVTVRIGG